MKTEIVVLIVVFLFLLIFLVSFRGIRKIQDLLRRVQEGINILKRYFKR